MFKKTYLANYKMNSVQPLNSGCWHFTMLLKRVWFWGLVTTKDAVQYLIPQCDCLETTTQYWDKLIKDRVEIRQ